MTTIKLPACYDVSFWQQKIDWSAVVPKPALVICKASEGVGIKDPTFLPNFAGLASQNIRRGCYHFHRKIYTGLQNATYFLGVVRGILTKQDLIVLDVEEGGESAAQLLAWLDAVSAAYPDNLILIYSRKTVLDTIAATPTQAARLRQYPTWMAGYPLNPDNYNDIPAGYVPDPTKWGAVYLWQYSDKGIVQGISGNTVDLNWISPTLQTIIGAVQPPTGETNMILQQVKNAAGLNLRPAVGTTNTPIKIVADGTKLWGNDLGNNWLEISYYQQPTEATATALHCYGYEPLTVSLPYADPPQPAPKPAHTVDVLIDGVNVFHKDLF